MYLLRSRLIIFGLQIYRAWKDLWAPITLTQCHRCGDHTPVYGLCESCNDNLET